MSSYHTLVKLVKSNFSSDKGVVVNLRSDAIKNPVSLCASARRNAKRLVPEECILWSGDKKLYEGKLKSKRLERILERMPLCSAEVTNASDMAYGPGDFICMGNPKECQSRNCKCRCEDYYTRMTLKYPELKEECVVMDKEDVRDVIMEAWTGGYKMARGMFRARNRRKKMKLKLKGTANDDFVHS